MFVPPVSALSATASMMQSPVGPPHSRGSVLAPLDGGMQHMVRTIAVPAVQTSAQTPDSSYPTSPMSPTATRQGSATQVIGRTPSSAHRPSPLRTTGAAPAAAAAAVPPSNVRHSAGIGCQCQCLRCCQHAHGPFGATMLRRIACACAGRCAACACLHDAWLGTCTYMCRGAYVLFLGDAHMHATPPRALTAMWGTTRRLSAHSTPAQCTQRPTGSASGRVSFCGCRDV